MILIGVGGNLPSAAHGGPRETCAAALMALEAPDLRIAHRSRWFATSPVPASNQPDFVNGVAALDTTLPPDAVLERLHAVERRFGRARSIRNAPRIIDLDLLDHDGLVRTEKPILPHPRMRDRAFVLIPLADVAPDWRHPATGETLQTLIAALPDDQIVRPLETPA